MNTHALRLARDYLTQAATILQHMDPQDRADTLMIEACARIESAEQIIGEILRPKGCS